jgi:hypothetical protein
MLRLPLLALPEGFSYSSYGWTGDPMSDSRPTPGSHDGMAVVGWRFGSGPHGGKGDDRDDREELDQGKSADGETVSRTKRRSAKR